MGAVIDQKSGETWTLYQGDSCEIIRDVADESIGLSVFSPPFPGMYAYTDSDRDLGNSKSMSELLAHFSYIIPEILRITMPGRSCAIHLTQEPVFKGRDGYVGLRDFRGDMIRAMEAGGWIFYGEHTIDKCPQLKAIRTKDHSLLFKTLGTDSADCRAAMADHLIQFRKPGENAVKIPSGNHPRWNPDGGWITANEWIEWAAPVWYRAGGAAGYPEHDQSTSGIRETDVLKTKPAKEDRDEKHICPLQLGVIERCVKLWSAPGDVVFSPFAGIGSEGYTAVRLGRRFVGIELKASYWRAACGNIARAEAMGDQGTLFGEHLE